MGPFPGFYDSQSRTFEALGTSHEALDLDYFRRKHGTGLIEARPHLRLE
jgi:hypothetical protein